MLRFPIELSQFVRLFMAAENVYFLELLYSVAVDKSYQFLQQMTTEKKTSFFLRLHVPVNVGIGGSPAAWGSCIAYTPVCGNFLSIAEGESGLGYLNPVLAKTYLYLRVTPFLLSKPFLYSADNDLALGCLRTLYFYLPH